ncbi:MAG: deoxyribodipyrimidine photo-lyase [Dongiaceae bacterium]
MAKSQAAQKPLGIVWFRRDLRLADNEALAASAAANVGIVPLFIDDDGHGSARRLGGAARWWRGRSLSALDESLRAVGSRLIVRHGALRDTLDSLLTETGGGIVYLNRHCNESDEEGATIAWLRERGVTVESFEANYLHDPLHLRTSGGGGFKVFTPFWNRLQGHYQPPSVLPAPKRLEAPVRWPDGLSLDALQVTDPWAGPIAEHWRPGEAAARRRLGDFAKQAADYVAQRDMPDRDGTSRLSPHLAWGEISVHEIWRHLHRAIGDKAVPFLRQLGWRDFNMHLLSDFPHLSWQPMQAKFAAFPARGNDLHLRAWQRGQTGYPIVDAGMRQLWRTGWMHNRVRMIVGSFLVKDLLIPWQRGEEWFWDTLVDADPAQNGGNWQWVAGCGADAAPFFRVFNPVLQSEKFDPKGAYVRHWVPELAALPDRVIHQPWTASAKQLADAGVKLGKSYPWPMVDHAKARQAALAAYQRISKGTGPDMAEPSLF